MVRDVIVAILFSSSRVYIKNTKIKQTDLEREKERERERERERKRERERDRQTIHFNIKKPVFVVKKGQPLVATCENSSLEWTNPPIQVQQVCDGALKKRLQS